MTRARCTRSSKRKPDASSQESLPGECKENSPLILSQLSSKPKNFNKKIQAKENTPTEKNSTLFATSVVNKENVFSPVKKSVRTLKVKEQSTITKFLTPKTVLSDRTNSPGLRPKQTNAKEIEQLEKQENEASCAPKLTLFLKSNCAKPQIQNCSEANPHIPVYNTVSPLVTPKRKNLPPEKKEALYDFEVDENEEPMPKRKRKKRAYVRKPKVGPKALTINNIKYSSTESLASLPEKPVRQKKKGKPTKCNLKTNLSTITLNNPEDSRVTVDSFMSHPSSVLLCKNSQEPRNELSVLRETISEECQDECPVIDNPSPPITHCSSSISKPNSISVSHHSHFSPNPRCYSSKFSRTPNPSSEILENSYLGANITFPHQVSSCSANSSRAPLDFLSSTPCKRSSMVVQNNSVFDETGGSNASRLVRSGVGIVRDSSASANSTDKCFGFDEPEEIEEPLVSPIKSSIDLVKPQRHRVAPLRLHVDDPQPKVSAQEVIEMLKATLPKSDKDHRESTEPFEFSSQESSPELSPAVCQEKETAVFCKVSDFTFFKVALIQSTQHCKSLK